MMNFTSMPGNFSLRAPAPSDGIPAPCPWTLASSTSFGLSISWSWSSRGPRFVIEQDGKLSGYSSDLWNEVARQAGWDRLRIQAGRYVSGDDRRAEIGPGRCRGGRAFDHCGTDEGNRFLSSVLRFRPRYHGQGWLCSRPLDILVRLLTPSLVLTFGGIMVALILVSHILLWFERKHNHEDFPHHYSEGMIESIWWTTCVLSAACA